MDYQKAAKNLIVSNGWNLRQGIIYDSSGRSYKAYTERLHATLRDFGDPDPAATISELKRGSIVALDVGGDLEVDQFVDRFIEDHQITALATGTWESDTLTDLASLNGAIVTHNVKMKALATQRSIETGEKIKPSRIDKRDALDYLHYRIAEMVRARKQELFETLEFDGNKTGLRHLRDLCRMFARDRDDPGKFPDMFYTVLYHFVWCVKRKIFKRPVLDHLVPYFHSPQGAGKTTLMRKFLAPLQELYIETDIKSLLGEFQTRILENHYVAHLDESAHAKSVALEEVKSLITQEHTAKRDMYSPLAKRRPVNISTIVSSNSPLAKTFPDYTGMRRFFEISHRLLDFDLVNSVDYLQIWRAVDESCDASPLRRNSEIYEAIGVEQEKHRAHSTIERFLLQSGYLRYDEKQTAENTAMITETDLFSEYSAWSQMYTDRKADIGYFASQMLYFSHSIRSWVNRRGIRRYRVFTPESKSATVETGFENDDLL